MGRIYDRKVLPNGVGRIPLFVLKKILYPSSFSRFLMARLKTDCETNKLLAALFIERVFSTSNMYLN